MVSYKKNNTLENKLGRIHFMTFFYIVRLRILQTFNIDTGNLSVLFQMLK